MIDIDLVAEVYAVLKEYVPEVEREEAANSVVTVLKDHEVKEDAIIVAFDDDNDILRCLGVDGDEEDEYYDEDEYT